MYIYIYTYAHARVPFGACDSKTFQRVWSTINDCMNLYNLWKLRGKQHHAFRQNKLHCFSQLQAPCALIFTINVIDDTAYFSMHAQQTRLFSGIFDFTLCHRIAKTMCFTRVNFKTLQSIREWWQNGSQNTSPCNAHTFSMKATILEAMPNDMLIKRASAANHLSQRLTVSSSNLLLSNQTVQIRRIIGLTYQNQLLLLKMLVLLATVRWM